MSRYPRKELFFNLVFKGYKTIISIENDRTKIEISRHLSIIVYPCYARNRKKAKKDARSLLKINKQLVSFQIRVLIALEGNQIIFNGNRYDKHLV